MKNTIVAYIQIIPIGEENFCKAALEKIQVDIEQCGLPMKKQQFGYAIEGAYEPIMRICEALQLAAFNAGVKQIDLTIRMHSASGQNLHLNS